MAKMSLTQLKAILSSEHQDAMASMSNSKLSSEREDNLDYYNGVMSDMPSIEGRSSAISTDIADTIEGLMPSLMDIFASSDDVMEFDPVGPEDEEAAQQETDYLNYVFNQQNEGFLTLYSFVKDALLSKMGIVKVFWEKKKKEERETYFGLTDDQYAQIVADETMEVIEHTEYPEGGMPPMMPEGGMAA